MLIALRRATEKNAPKRTIDTEKVPSFVVMIAEFDNDDFTRYYDDNARHRGMRPFSENESSNCRRQRRLRRRQLLSFFYWKTSWRHEVEKIISIDLLKSNERRSNYTKMLGRAGRNRSAFPEMRIPPGPRRARAECRLRSHACSRLGRAGREMRLKLG